MQAKSQRAGGTRYTESLGAIPKSSNKILTGCTFCLPSFGAMHSSRSTNHALPFMPRSSDTFGPCLESAVLENSQKFSKVLQTLTNRPVCLLPTECLVFYCLWSDHWLTMTSACKAHLVSFSSVSSPKLHFQKLAWVMISSMQGVSANARFNKEHITLCLRWMDYVYCTG
jgi:hypothetical protein